MRRILFVLLLSALAAAQTTVPTIAPDEATQHLSKRITPIYPQLAEVARIQGNVILEVRIDELGQPKNISVIHGHPLLVQATIDAVKKARYSPFEINGKPAEVRTFVLVAFGKPYPPNDVNDHALVFALLGKTWLSTGEFAKAEQSFTKASELMMSLERDKSTDHEEWLGTMGRMNMNLAKAALGTGDFAKAEQDLNKASEDLTSMKHSQLTDQEELQATMGLLNTSQKKYSEAENNLKKALDLAQQNAPSSPDVVQKQGLLSQLYAQENNYDQARTYGEQEIETCEKYLKSGAKPEANQLLGNEIVYRSWMLTILALRQNDHDEAKKRCHAVIDYQSYLGPSYRDHAVATCQKELDQSNK